MKITWFYRSRQKGFSIQRCFQVLEPELGARNELTSYYVPYSGCSIREMAGNCWYTFRHRQRNGLNHITGDVYYLAWALPGKRTVATVHDLKFMETRNPVRRLLLYAVFLLPLKFCAKVLCISEKTRNELLRYVTIRPEKLAVIPDPLPGGFAFDAKEFPSENPLILQVGTKENKNLIRVAAALKNLRVRLRIIGKIDSRQQEELAKAGIDYTCVSNLSDAQIVEEYRRCDLLCFVSTYEGFGMPILEAQGIGRPVLTSALAPMSTVGGDGALYVSPYSPEEIRHGIERLMTEGMLRKQLIAAGRVNAERYSAFKIATELENIYRVILK